MSQGYYRFPTLFRDTVVFTSEDDLWSVPVTGGVARRLTSNLGQVSHPSFSPDGQWLIFVGRDEGQAEIYRMPATGGPSQRLTYLGGSICFPAGWTPEGHILFANNAAHWSYRVTHLYEIGVSGGPSQKLPYGPARSLTYGPGGAQALERSSDEPAVWKRYRGGGNGQLWVDSDGRGEFHRLLPELSNLTAPMWLGTEAPGRLYFLSDHEGIGNLYSCLPNGSDLRRHTHREDYYVRNSSSDGLYIVYHAGADLYLFDPVSGDSQRIDIEYYSPRVQRNRKFVYAAGYLEHLSLHPHGRALALTARGKLAAFYNWEGPVLPLREPSIEVPAPPFHENGEQASNPEVSPKPSVASGIRYRLPEWLPDGKRILAVTDSTGEESFVIFQTDPIDQPPQLLPRLDFGRPLAIAVHPKQNRIVFSNHRFELVFLDLETGEMRLIDRSKTNPIRGFSWSPDGEWVVYSVSISLETTVLKLWHIDSGEITQITRPVLHDVGPVFDPHGKYLYFLSYRTFNPVYDSLHLDLSFPRGIRPYLITLQANLPSPFVPRPPIEHDAEEVIEEEPLEETAPADSVDPEAHPLDEPAGESPPEIEPAKIRIDLDGIQDRIIEFPVVEGIYGHIAAGRNGKVFYSRYPLESATNRRYALEPPAEGMVLSYNIEDGREEMIVPGISFFDLSADGKTMLYRSGNQVRVIRAGDKPNLEEHRPGRHSGWIDLDRVRVEVVPGEEWRQMFREAWRLQRDYFWSEDMSQVDWLAAYERYLPLVDRAGSRHEISDLMWEMQGELGTSHAYELGGDFRLAPRYSQGKLGADFEFDSSEEAWRIQHIYRGDVWDAEFDSPLHQPGILAREGDFLLAVNGRTLDRDNSPERALIDLAGEEVLLTLAAPAASAGNAIRGRQTPRHIVVRTLRTETDVRYREWVDTNRDLVHQAGAGRLGYIHIPNMGPDGFAEFHRGFLAEFDREGLVVDVRYNSGGHISFLILEKLARRRLAYTTSRWSQSPEPYPPYAVAGPIVAITNEFTFSDGDVFSHAFKLMKIGPLIGTRTRGGVIGITFSRTLVDGAFVTQPEYATWFSDIGLGLENFGTLPDIQVEIRPQDWARGGDPQLERAIAEALQLLETNPLAPPDFSIRPSRAAPRLPPI